MYPSSSRILTRLIELRRVPLPLASSMQRSESESIFLVTPLCVNCSVVVSILAIGVQNDGKVSKSVGRELVSNGFMYLKGEEDLLERFKRNIETYFESKFPQTLASNAFSFFLADPLVPGWSDASGLSAS